MASEHTSATGLTTEATDYEGAYYTEAHLGGHGDYAWENDEWRMLFTGVARRIVGLLEPKTSLDVGCAKGLLVQALAAEGVDAHGIDISQHAVEAAHSDVRDRLSARSATEPIEGRYDLISCIECLEHMGSDDVQKAIDNMCAATDVILFSSNPADFTEPTHINTHSTSEWAAWFAERGFYRRLDIDASFLSPWAIVFERGEISRRGLVERYESRLGTAIQELNEKRAALLETQRRLSEMERPKAGGALDDELLARHSELTARDHVIGLEATVARLERDLRTVRSRAQKLRAALRKKESEIRALKDSRTWRVGRAVTGPLGKLRG